MQRPSSNSPVPVLQALAAAVLFASSTPLSKLLVGGMDPIPMAAFLYLGSGIGAFLLRFVLNLSRSEKQREAPITRPDLPWLIGAILFGGVLAPILLLFGLQITPASTASLLLNFEGAATALLAALLFKEAIGKKAGWSIGLITTASIILSLTWDEWGFSAGVFLILAAGVFWGLDNNLTRSISERDPLQIVMFKGLGAGLFSLILTFLLDKPLPQVGQILLVMGLGMVSYGLSIALIILAMRRLGSARAYAWFGSAPFIALLLSLVIFKETPPQNLWIGLPLMIAGAWLMLSEHHSHGHVHSVVAHEHAHSHPDAHHTHTHAELAEIEKVQHSHYHVHETLEHEHEHTPDIHHRHEHKD